MTNSIFDRTLIRRHRDRSASVFTQHDFLSREISDRLFDHIKDIARTFETALVLGGHHEDLNLKTVIQGDLSPRRLQKFCTGNRVALDTEFLPFSAQSFDLVVSHLMLHWVNDLPKTLQQISQSLKPDGCFMASLFAEETLCELRECLIEADIEVLGGAAARISPFATIQDMGSLLQRAGFALPVVEVDRITVLYDDMFTLLKDLQGMGETNACFKRYPCFTPKAVFEKAASLYKKKFATKAGKIPATFSVLYLTGWVPHDTQQKPMAPGSARHSLSKELEK